MTIKLTQDKETKGTFRFSSKDAAAPVDTLYVKKSWLGDANPKEIIVSIEVKDG